MLSQILAITMLNLRSLGSRLGASMVIIIGIAGVVGVLIALLAMARGFEATLGQTGRDDQTGQTLQQRARSDQHKRAEAHQSDEQEGPLCRWSLGLHGRGGHRQLGGSQQSRGVSDEVFVTGGRTHRGNGSPSPRRTADHVAVNASYFRPSPRR